jgi:hypothetical protein
MGVVAGARRTRLDVANTLDASALGKVQAACRFVNAEIARLRNQTIAIWAICAVGVVLLWVFTGAGDPRVLLLLAAGIVSIAFLRARTELQSSGNVAAKRIVAGLGSLAYNRRSSMTRKDFMSMDLFTDHCEKWKSRDEIACRMRGVKYSLHYVQAAGNNGKPAFFDGVIIKLEFNDNFPSHTVILPAQEARGTSNGTVQSRRKKDFVMVKNPAFEQVFDVYSTDYYEAKKFVTPAFMRVVLEARARLNTELRLCFLGRSLFVAVRGYSYRFDTTLFGAPLTPETAVGKLVHHVAAAQQLAQVHVDS